MSRLAAAAVAAIGMLAVSPAWPGQSFGMTFGLVGKSGDDEVFVAAWQGCRDEAARNGDTCVNYSPAGVAMARAQDRAVVQAMTKPLAALAISVTDSDYLAGSSLQLTQQVGLPVVTFDSDLNPGNVSLRAAYVGPDNVEFGRQLARLARDRHPHGGVLCLMSAGPREPNLNQRIAGIRRELSGNPEHPDGTRLLGERGWREPARCPWNSAGNPERAARQMTVSLTEIKADVFISVGAWPVMDIAQFRRAIEPIARAKRDAGRSVLVGIGQVSAEHQKLLEEKLVDAFVSIDFPEMGRVAYQAMKRLAAGKTVPARMPTSLRVVEAP